MEVSSANIPIIRDDEQAEEIARKTKADIVIYGNVSVIDETAEFFPRFFVAEKANTSEIVGTSELGYPINFDVSETGFSDEVNVLLRRRAAILTNLTQGLVYLKADDFDAAEYARPPKTGGKLRLSSRLRKSSRETVFVETHFSPLVSPNHTPLDINDTRHYQYRDHMTPRH